jgi:chromosome segregation ATPase
MTPRSAYRVVIGLVLSSVALGGLVLAQSATRQAPASLDDLLSEIKGLRADMAQSSAATIKTQLLVARLQVEEQRMNGITKQIVDVQTQLAAARLTVAAAETEVKHFEDILSRGIDSLPEAEKKGFAAMVGDVKSKLEIQQRREQELSAQEGALSNQFASEQARWSDFNDRLDALERGLATR